MSIHVSMVGLRDGAAVVVGALDGILVVGENDGY